MPRIDDIMLTDAERATLRAKRRRRIVLLVVATMLLAGGYFAARPGSRAIKAWQARRHAEKAFALIEQEKWNEARAEVTAAYQLQPGTPDAVRAVARFLSRTRQPQALEFWDQLGKLSSLTRADLRDEAAIALLAGDDGRASHAVAELHEAKNGEAAPIDELLAAQLALRRGAADEAHAAVEKVENDQRATSREKLQGALLQLAAAGEHIDWRTQAWLWTKNVAQGQDAAALDALTVLAQTLVNAKQTPENFPFAVADLAQALDAHPLAHAPQKLLAQDLRIREQPERRAQLIDEAIVQWKTADATEIVALATWLNGKGDYQRLLDALPVDRALQSRDLFLQYVDALGGLGRWSDIKQLLESDQFPLDPVVQAMYLARCNAQLGEKTAAENNWQRALEAAHGDAGKLLTLAAYAEKNGAIGIAAHAYDMAAAESPKLRQAQQGRLRIAQAHRDTKQIHDVLAEMLQAWPNDSAVQNDEAYTRLLLPGQNSESENAAAVDQLAERLVAAEPTSLPHRTLLAFARLKQGHAADALKVYESLHVPQQALTPSALAVHAAVLAANGNASDAHTEAKQIAPGSLLPEEEALIAGL